MSKLKKVTLHIGPGKTGTTTIQAVLSASRDILAAREMLYVSSNKNSDNVNHAALGLLNDPNTKSDPREWRNWDRSDVHWGHVKRALHTSALPTAVMSGEELSHFPDEAISRLKRELSGWEIHLVVTARPLSQIIPSYWQQRAKHRAVPTLIDFTERLLHPSSSDAEIERFWRPQHHDQLVKRWQELLQPANTTVIVVSKDQPNNLLDGFSKVLGIEPRLLAAVHEKISPTLLKNTSMTQERVHVLQSLLQELEARDLLTSALQLLEMSNFPASPLLTEHKLNIQARFAQDVALIERQIVDGLRQLDLSVVGDLELLAPPLKSAATQADGEDDQLSQEALIAIAGHMTAAMLFRAGLRPNGRVDLSVLAKRATLSHLWLLAIKNTIWAVVPLSLRARIRPLIRRWAED